MERPRRGASGPRKSRAATEWRATFSGETPEGEFCGLETTATRSRHGVAAGTRLPRFASGQAGEPSYEDPPRSVGTTTIRAATPWRQMLGSGEPSHDRANSEADYV